MIAKAAKMLGMSYRTLQYRLDKFGIKKPEGRGTRRPRRLELRRGEATIALATSHQIVTVVNGWYFLIY